MQIMSRTVNFTPTSTTPNTVLMLLEQTIYRFEFDENYEEIVLFCEGSKPEEFVSEITDLFLSEDIVGIFDINEEIN